MKHDAKVTGHPFEWVATCSCGYRRFVGTDYTEAMDWANAHAWETSHPIAHFARTAGWWLLVGVFCLILLALFVLRTLAWLGWRW